MNDSIHVHRLSPAWWIAYIFCGAILLFSIAGAVITTILSSDARPLDVVRVLIVTVIGLPLGLFAWVQPFLTKMIVKPEGIEYHARFFILQANWNHLVNRGYVRKVLAGKTLVVVPREGKLRYRKWAKPFRILVTGYPNTLQDVVIFVSPFGGYGGHSFETDILVNVTQYAGFPENVESWKS